MNSDSFPASHVFKSLLFSQAVSYQTSNTIKKNSSRLWLNMRNVSTQGSVSLRFEGGMIRAFGHEMTNVTSQLLIHAPAKVCFGYRYFPATKLWSYQLFHEYSSPFFFDAVKSNCRAGGILNNHIHLGKYELGFIQSNNIKIKSENSWACQSQGIVL